MYESTLLQCRDKHEVLTNEVADLRRDIKEKDAQLLLVNEEISDLKKVQANEDSLSLNRALYAKLLTEGFTQ